MTVSWMKKHLVHGSLFILGGLFMLGRYITFGEPFVGEEAGIAWGPPMALLIMGFGFILLIKGEHFINRDNEVIEYYDAFVIAVGFALVVRTFLFEPFKIPSGSMIPTLQVGDYLFVNKFSYGQRIPFTTLRLFMGEGPQRGDIAVFEYPQDPTKDYIKRIVGLPGDRVVYKNKRLYLNNTLIENIPDGVYSYLNEQNQLVESARFDEQLGAKTHPILLRPFVYSDHQVDEIVPIGHYFVMGDNRDNSNDSRYWGFVPAYRLVGRAVALFWSWDDHIGRPRWERIGHSLE
ncbi:MAG: signal peptidase I [Magnetococcus sp. DMHC-6]